MENKNPKTIIVPVDGASNIKLEVFDFDTLRCLSSQSAPTPVTEDHGLKYNATREELDWFDSAIQKLPEEMKHAAVIAPVSRGASGGLIGLDNSLIEVPGKGLTLSYTQTYPDHIEQAFSETAGDERDFFLETGSVREFPGSITLLKRFLFEEMERPDILERSACFAAYGILISGHFLGGDFIRACRIAGNEHSYWMCHSGARNINEVPGTPSACSHNIASFRKLVPQAAVPVYIPIGFMPEVQMRLLGLTGETLVIPGGHDTCLSHIPVIAAYTGIFKDLSGTPVIHVEAGSWTLAAQIGGSVDLPPDGYKRDIVVQGTVDGEPVVTARYGGGNDFRHMNALAEKHGHGFTVTDDSRPLMEILEKADSFVLPNVSPMNRSTGPFPSLNGAIINETRFFSAPDAAYIITNLTTALTTSHQIASLGKTDTFSIVLTGGGSKDLLFGRLLATLAGNRVIALTDSNGAAISETTALGAAITGKAAVLGCHPYKVDVGTLGITCREIAPFPPELKKALEHYSGRFVAEIKRRL